MTNYIVRYELSTSTNEVVSDEMTVEAVSEDRAVEHAANVLDQQYDDSVLLECEVVGTRG